MHLVNAHQALETYQGRKLGHQVSESVRAVVEAIERDPPEAERMSQWKDPFLRHVALTLSSTPPASRQVAVLGAIVDAFELASDNRGNLSLDRIKARLGTKAAKVFNKLANFSPLEAHYLQPGSEAQFDGMRSITAEKVAAGSAYEDLAPRMPVLGDMMRILSGDFDGWVKEVKSGPNPPSDNVIAHVKRQLDQLPKEFFGAEKLKDWDMTSLGHLFGSRRSLYEMFEAYGLLRENHLITGKSYSQQPDVVVQMKADGFQMDPALTETRQSSNDRELETDRAVKILEQTFAQIDPKDDVNIMFLDEGGYLTVALHNHFPEHLHQVRVVEQTEHGRIQVKKELTDKGIEVKVPILNVAQSWLKKILESPAIGEAVVWSAEKDIAEMGKDIWPKTMEAVMLGFGAVNSAVADRLEARGYQREDIWVFDTKASVMIDARNRGYKTALPEDKSDEWIIENWESIQDQVRDEVLAHGHVTVSATGHEALSPHEMGKLPNGAVLFSAGSGAKEFGMHTMHDDGLKRADPKVVGEEAGVLWARSENGELTPKEGAAAVLGLMEDKLAHRPGPVVVNGFGEYQEKAILALLDEGYYKPEDILVYSESRRERRVARDMGLNIIDRETSFNGGRLYITREPLLQVPMQAQVVYLGDDDPEQNVMIRTEPESRDMDGRWRTWFQGMEVDAGEIGRADPFRHRVLYTGNGKEVMILRSGYVVNLFRGLPPEYAQLIYGLLAGATLQATFETEPGPRAVNDIFQHLLKNLLQIRLKQRDLSLWEPDYRTLMV